MYSGETIIVDEQSIISLSKRNKEKMYEILEWFRYWTEFFKIDPDIRILVRYVGDEDYKMMVDEDKADYFAYVVDVTAECLHSERDEYREMDVIHETLHMLIYPYSRIAYTLLSGNAKKLLMKAEESIVSKLEMIIIRLCYGDECNPPPAKPEETNGIRCKRIRV